MSTFFLQKKKKNNSRLSVSKELNSTIVEFLYLPFIDEVSKNFILSKIKQEVCTVCLQARVFRKSSSRGTAKSANNGACYQLVSKVLRRRLNRAYPPIVFQTRVNDVQPLLFSRFKLRSWAASAARISATSIFRFVILYTRWPIESQHLDFMPFLIRFPIIRPKVSVRESNINTFEDKKNTRSLKIILKRGKIE